MILRNRSTEAEAISDEETTISKDTAEVTNEITTNEKDSKSISRDFQCNHCEKSYKTAAARRQHIFNSHSPLALIENYGASMTVEVNGKDEFTCPMCCTSLKGYKNFTNHMTRQHPTLPRPKKLIHKRSIEHFSFDEGCASVLQDCNGNKKQKYGGLAKYHDFVPAKLSIKQPTNNKAVNTMYLPLFISSPSENALSNFIAPNTNFEAKLVFSSNDPCEDTTTITTPNSTSNNLSSFHSRVQSGRYPKVLSVIGPFRELNRDLEEALNCGFSQRQHLLPLIPDLFVGGVIQAKNFALLITSCELYARDANIDEHLESNGNTFPYRVEAESRRYERITIEVVRQSDGGAIINKLQIGTTQFNLLVTGCLLLYPHLSSTTSIGPGCNAFLIHEKMKTFAILFSETNMQKYMTAYANISNINPKIPKIEDVRQLTTLLQHPSTYLNYRSHLLEDRLLHPATIFTLSKYPTRGYGMSVGNQSRLLSEFFTICCECVLFHDSFMTTDMIIPLKIKLDNEGMQEAGTGVSLLVNDLIEYIQICRKNETNCNILAFLSKREKLSAISQTISNQLSAANKKIEANLETELYRIFGSTNATAAF